MRRKVNDLGWTARGLLGLAKMLAAKGLQIRVVFLHAARCVCRKCELDHCAF
jgi:hypothetical protein